MKASDKKIVLTGFMGVGKTTVARRLSYLLRVKHLDLDNFIETEEKTSIPELLTADSELAFRKLETRYLIRALEQDADIVSLGGGAWTTEMNRDIIKKSGFTSIWLESSFEHCWRNIKSSRRERPLAKDKRKAKELFDVREEIYCLADWHFVIKPGNDSFDVAKQIAVEVFGN